MKENELCQIIEEALENAADFDEENTLKIKSFEEAGLLTRDMGLVVEIEGNMFEITVIKIK